MRLKHSALGLTSLFFAVLVGGVCVFGQFASALSGSDFRPAQIMDDTVFFNSATLNGGDIQNVLNAKVPICDTNGTQPSGHAGYTTRADWGRANGVAPPYTCLKDYSQNFPDIAANSNCGGISGGTKSAANIIFDIARACSINPQVLIVLLQKEQTLVTDEWPWPIQYRSATGFGCPDTAPCDSQYYGFFNQVYNAARQFKRYVAQPDSFNYAVGRNSFVAYNPQGSCSGTSLAIGNATTAALYNYTPYQPNAAALANLYGTGDACSAYGNRNFWRIYYDWFGNGARDGYVLGMNIDDNSQWVVYNGIKQYVPSGEIKAAWGLPDSPIPMTGNSIAGYPTGPPLGRLFHLSGSPALYFADGGKKYMVPNTRVRDTWGFTGQVESFVSRDLWSLPADAGTLSYSVKSASNSALYMVDGLNGSGQTVLRQYSSPDVHKAWEGDSAPYVTLSDTYFARIDNAVGASLSGFTVKSANDPSQYQVVAGQKLYLSSAVAPLYNQTVQTVSDATISRLVTSSPATQFVRANNDPKVYLVDGGKKHYVNSGNLIDAWGGANVNIVTAGDVNLIPEDTANPVQNHLADVSGQVYIVDGTKHAIPNSLKTVFTASDTPLTATASLTSLLANGSTANGFLKSSSSPAVYLIDGGQKRYISSAATYGVWSGGQTPTVLSQSAVNGFANGNDVGSFYVTNGTINAVIDGGTYYTVSNAIAADWGLSNPIVVNLTTLNALSSGGSLSNKVRSGAAYYLLKYGKSHITYNTNLANIWGINTSGPDLSQALVSSVPADNPLTIFVRSNSSSEQRIFAADANNKLYTFSAPQQVQNYGYMSGDMLQLSPADISAMTITPAKEVLRQGATGNYSVIDWGSKRTLDSGAQSQWLTGSNYGSVSDYFWNFIPSGQSVGRTIKGPRPEVYAITGGVKAWIQSGPTYAQSYAPYEPVSQFLVDLLPTGNAIP